MEFRKCKTKGRLRASRRGRCWGLETGVGWGGGLSKAAAT